MPGTAPLREEQNLTERVIDGASAFMANEIKRVAGARETLWKPDYSSQQAYETSVEPNRKRFQDYIGLKDTRVAADDLELVAKISQPALAAESAGVSVHAVRWRVLPGVDAEGLLLEPKGPARAQVVVLPEADWAPESVAGLENGVPGRRQVARRLAESGCRVLVPTLIDRSGKWSGPLGGRKAPNLSHRELVYIVGYCLNRHIIGYEVQRTLAAVDYFKLRDASLPVGVLGFGEGGLIAMYSAAADTRIDATLVSGYFQKREELWREPTYRNVWGLLHEFGDAGVARLIAPRGLVVEASRGPVGPGRPATNAPAQATDGALASPPIESVRAEYELAASNYRRVGAPAMLTLAISGDGQGEPFTDAGVAAFLRKLGAGAPAPVADGVLTDRRRGFDPATRLHRQYDQLVAHTQEVMRASPFRRSEFWAKKDPLAPLARNTYQQQRAFVPDKPYPLDKWVELTGDYRQYFWEEVLGRSPPPSLPPNARTRQFLDEPRYNGYEVVMDVWPEVINYGVILVPKGLRPGERRPVVVVQHGHQDFPKKVTDPHFVGQTIYQAAGAELADRGFIVYAPQNLYTLAEKFPLIQRMGHPLKQSMWSIMIGQHQQLVRWLQGLPMVAPERIGFYGLSYGGKSAVFLPAVIEEYALSICSGDWTERVWKNSNLLSDFIFAWGGHFSQIEFNFADTFNYAEISGLIAPRPFMVERGHYDGVSP
ncbi:MAG: dienelactone hydrolase family protein, partial [Verrucomicrobia bacterium]|nr:dienelactone hydrolase family protein [Verrucomicrobiota bacterium]